ncbi:MAG: restriction endonuclease subunit S [Chlorobium sp.]|nr:MAG: restriction endonuclease subunit S [Chlorobium sp.]
MNENVRSRALLEQYFDIAFAVPDGIKKLRELILTLAMQGKLVPQDPNDQPASELLKEIETEKRKLVKVGKIRELKPLQEINSDEVPCELPNGWSWTRLGDVVVSIIGGGTPSKNNPSYWGGDIPWASVKDLNVDIYLEKTIDSITNEGLENSSTNLIPSGSIIVCTRMGLGKICINTVDIAINQDLKALTVSSNVDKMFFFKKYQNYDIKGQGVTVKGIRQDELLSLFFPLPPLAEQKRIVARIDQLMARCDELEKLRSECEAKRLTVHISALNRLFEAQGSDSFTDAWQFINRHFSELYAVKANVTELRKAILQLGVMGKLVPQDPNDQPARELLNEIEAEKRSLVKEGKIKPQKPLPEIKSQEQPYALPEGWVWVRLGELGFTQTGTTPPSKDQENFGSYLPFIGPGNLKHGSIDYSGDGISEIGLSKSRLIEQNSVLMVCIGGSIGKHAVNNRDITCNQQINTLTPYQPIQVKYIFYAMASKSFQNLVIVQAGGSATPIINKQKWSSIPIPIPPLPEQHRIVAKIDKLMALRDQLEQQIDATACKQSVLLNAVMSRM